MRERTLAPPALAPSLTQTREGHQAGALPEGPVHPRFPRVRARSWPPTTGPTSPERCHALTPRTPSCERRPALSMPVVAFRSDDDRSLPQRPSGRPVALGGSSAPLFAGSRKKAARHHLFFWRQLATVPRQRKRGANRRVPGQSLPYARLPFVRRQKVPRRGLRQWGVFPCRTAARSGGSLVRR